MRGPSVRVGFRSLILLVVTVIATAGPAAAQQPVGRDPFAPVVTADQAGEGTTGGASGEIDPVVPGAVTETEPLPTTGAEPRSWLAIAYILVVMGVGALVVSRVMTAPPQRVRAREPLA